MPVPPSTTSWMYIEAQRPLTDPNINLCSPKLGEEVKSFFPCFSRSLEVKRSPHESLQKFTRLTDTGFYENIDSPIQSSLSNFSNWQAQSFVLRTGLSELWCMLETLARAFWVQHEKLTHFRVFGGFESVWNTAYEPTYTIHTYPTRNVTSTTENARGCLFPVDAGVRSRPRNLIRVSLCRAFCHFLLLYFYK